MKSEMDTPNDILREKFDLGQMKKDNSNSWKYKGVIFPNGTEFKRRYKGEDYFAKVENGELVMNGKKYPSLSQAAWAITKNNVNCWRFWECKMPGQTSWVLIDRLRKTV
jgi:hypothetical protein